jgi:hypothetical protein
MMAACLVMSRAGTIAALFGAGELERTKARQHRTAWRAFAADFWREEASCYSAFRSI